MKFILLALLTLSSTAFGETLRLMSEPEIVTVKELEGRENSGWLGSTYEDKSSFTRYFNGHIVLKVNRISEEECCELKRVETIEIPVRIIAYVPKGVTMGFAAVKNKKRKLRNIQGKKVSELLGLYNGRSTGAAFFAGAGYFHAQNENGIKIKDFNFKAGFKADLLAEQEYRVDLNMNHEKVQKLLDSTLVLD